MVNLSRKYISERFSSLKTNKVVVAARELLDIRSWPTDKEQLAVFGEDSLNTLILHFNHVMVHSGIEISMAVQELSDLKVIASRLFNSLSHDEKSSLALLNLWQRVFLESEENLQNILKVVSICLILPLSTAVCERGFSTMNRVKTDWRSCLKSETLEKLMRISIDGVPLESFDPLRSIQEWWVDGTRSRRPNVSDSC